MNVWERIRQRAVGAFWAALAFVCSSPPHCVVLAHFFAVHGFSSHLVNLRSLNIKGGGGGSREEMRQMWISD